MSSLKFVVRLITPRAEWNKPRKPRHFLRSNSKLQTQMNKQLNLFPEHRATSKQAIAITVDSIKDYAEQYKHWRVCNIWDWLMIDAPWLGFDTGLLAEVYGGDEAVEMNARTGCICCPLASKDMALEYLVALPQWAYLKPLLKLRSLYEWAREFQNRHQKVGEKKKDGSYSSAPNRKGPLTLAARKELLEKILAVQESVNSVAIQNNRPVIDLINSQERSRIEELIALKTFPNRWNGDEPIGDEIVPQYDSSGNLQRSLFSN